MKAMVCNQCGANIILDVNREFGFCSYCGAKIQINETVIHKHTGEVSLDGIATANSIVQKGFMDLAQGDYKKARETFEKAQEIEPTNTLVLFGLACATLDPDGYFMNQLIAKHNEISDQEKSVINSSNAKFFSKIYLYYDLPSRFDYVIKNYHLPINSDLLGDKHDYSIWFHNYTSSRDYRYIIGIMKSGRKIDTVNLLIKNAFSVDSIGVNLIEKATISSEVNPYGTFSLNVSSDVLSPETFDKLLSNGLNPNVKIRYRTHRADKDGYPEYCTGTSSLEHLVQCHFKNKSYRDSFNKYHPQEKPKGCYVATCVYGSYDCPEVWTLRRYRDNVLDKTLFGKVFITLYYAVSPKIIKLFGNTHWFRSFWKSKLDRMVNKLRNKGIESTPYNDKY